MIVMLIQTIQMDIEYEIESGGKLMESLFHQ